MLNGQRRAHQRYTLISHQGIVSFVLVIGNEMLGLRVPQLCMKKSKVQFQIRQPAGKGSLFLFALLVDRRP